MKKIIILIALTFCANAMAVERGNLFNMNCYERLDVRRSYQRSIIVYRILTLGLIGAVNRQRIKGTRRTYKILKKAYECEYGCDDYGYTFNKFKRRLEKRIGYELASDDLVQALISASDHKEICPKDETVARRHYNYNELLEHMVYRL